jgi:hypothetical protein
VWVHQGYLADNFKGFKFSQSLGRVSDGRLFSKVVKKEG